MSGNIRFGCAPIAWTNDDLPELGKENTFEQCISEMALAGYEGTEIGNKYPKAPSQLLEYLTPRNLQVASAWLSLYLTTEPYEKTADLFIEHRDFLYELGAKVIVVCEQGKSIQREVDKSVFTKKPQFTEKEWTLLVEGLNRLGELAQEKGMEIVYHPHMGTGVQTDAEIQKLMEQTDKNKVSLLYDTGHLALSGENALAIFDKYKDRIKHIHFKDIRRKIAQISRLENASFLTSIKKGIFTVPGDGYIDFAPIMEAIQKFGYQGWIIVEAEQDPDKANPFCFAKKAKQYLDEINQYSEQSYIS
ncbi:MULTISPECIES: myo-inosose-2 dehydratase [unclassified Staphylococcus]|uniref:myo-inosose-2 dehydratase n=1 Tax=unclassified Staphylococcus TaxID=91994 RepID=UPI00124C1491|nr:MULTISPECIES: myo-inosose-2 dehydratase [unclassified Staphylococcus]KAB2478273.1 myo-inosose-2 dehydratase [Staphylococcus sp. CH99b_3]